MTRASINRNLDEAAGPSVGKAPAIVYVASNPTTRMKDPIACSRLQAAVALSHAAFVLLLTIALDAPCAAAEESAADDWKAFTDKIDSTTPLRWRPPRPVPRASGTGSGTARSGSGTRARRTSTCPDTSITRRMASPPPSGILGGAVAGAGRVDRQQRRGALRHVLQRHQLLLVQIRLRALTPAR